MEENKKKEKSLDRNLLEQSIQLNRELFHLMINQNLVAEELTRAVSTLEKKIIEVRKKLTVSLCFDDDYLLFNLIEKLTISKVGNAKIFKILEVLGFTIKGGQ